MTPVKSELDYDSDSDISSDMEEVLGNNNDIEMATARWTGAQCNSARITRTDGLSFMGDNKTLDEVDDYFPPGCSFDMTRPPSPCDVRDFPRLTVTPRPASPPPNPDEDTPVPASVNTTAALDASDPFADALDELQGDLVVPIDCRIRAIGINNDNTSLYISELNPSVARALRLHTSATGELIDGGANVGMTSDKSKLIGVRAIDPTPIGLAVDDTVTKSICVEMGFLPMNKVDGTIHYQPMLIHPEASDTILSPDSVLRASKDLVTWVQTGHRDNSPGNISFLDNSGIERIVLPLEKRNGLYYTTQHSYGVDNNPLRTRCSAAAVKAYTDIFEEIDDDASIHSSVEALQSLHVAHVDSFTPVLPSLIETDTFEPFLDPLAEVPFDEDPFNTPYSNKVDNKPSPPPKKSSYRRRPVEPAKHLESELWAARLGFCGEWQLDVIPACATGLPNHFDYHPFRFIDHKEQARIRRQAAGRKVERVKKCGQRFYVDFGFMRASNTDFSRPNTKEDRVIQSYDGYNSYLAIIDEHSRHAWVYLSVSKEPPIEEMSAHLDVFGLAKGGLLRCDQGGELARSEEFRTTMLEKYNYKVEPTGADSPSQNGGVERWNETFAVTVRALLYGSALPAEYWSSALLHAVYLHNRRVHKETKRTPFEGWYGKMPHLRDLKLFGSRVCVKRTGKRRSKLDQHDFRGIFLGYTATDNNIVYKDLDTGIVKTTHHAVFDEAWYLQPHRPPAAQLLYDLGLVEESDLVHAAGVEPMDIPAYPPPIPSKKLPPIPSAAKQLPLPLRLTDTPNSVAARAAKTSSSSSHDPYAGTVLESRNRDGSTVDEYGITHRDVAQIYCSPSPYCDAFEEELNMRRFNSDNHPTAGFKFDIINGRLIVKHIEKSSPGARIPRWRTRIRGSWLRKVGDTVVETVEDVKRAFKSLNHTHVKQCWLTFSHPEVKHGLTNTGIPQCNIDQLNPRLMFENFDVPSIDTHHQLEKTFSGDVFNYVTVAMKLKRGNLMKDTDWDEWQCSEYTQLDQYDAQGMFGEPVCVSDNKGAIFNLVWTYVIKELDKRKKARCTCDGSTRAGQVRVLDHTYANCVDQTGSRLFYAISTGENMMVFGADVSNAFAEAPAPKQGFYIRPDKAFRDWWENHKHRPPIPKGYVIPVQSAMQGHPESPRLWEKHADAILRECGLTPTVHEPCLYSGIVNNERVLFKRQVDDFAVAAPSEATANVLFDMIDEKLTFPLKRMGLVTMFNGLDIQQTRDYVKVSVQTYIERICEKHLSSWMSVKDMPDRPTPLPTRANFMTSFLSAKGDPDEKAQANLAKKMGFGYRSGIGELIYAMITCRPDLSYATVAAAQNSACPAEIHYHGVRNILKYLYLTRTDGIYFWRTEPNMDLPYVEPPKINSNVHDLLLDGRPKHDALDLHSYMDATWASCLKTRRSFGGLNLRLAGGPVAYKAWLQATVALSSTESEFISASDCGKVLLYVRSIMWDLGVPQSAATIAYEDNDACTAMANAQKPTTRTRHIDTRYHALCEWVERDLIKLERVDTSKNMADHFTKQLTPTLFNRHVDYIMGHVPPQYSPCYNYLTDLLQSTKKKVTPTLPPPITITPPTSAHDITHFPTAAAAAKVFINLTTSWSRIIGTSVG